jgi:hypothetical protein
MAAMSTAAMVIGLLLILNFRLEDLLLGMRPQT